MSKGQVYPHEKRVLRYAYIAGVAGLALAAFQTLAGDGKLRGFEIPPFALLGLALAGGIVGFVAVARRTPWLSFVGGGLLVVAVLPGGAARPDLLDYSIGILFGVAVLAQIELVHMTERYEHAHRAVDTENVPEEHINRVTDEALKTLASRATLAALAVAAALALAHALRAWGPRQWRAAAETTAPLGVAIVALALAGAASLYILARGSKLKLRREETPKELLPDVAE